MSSTYTEMHRTREVLLPQKRWLKCGKRTEQCFQSCISGLPNSHKCLMYVVSTYCSFPTKSSTKSTLNLFQFPTLYLAFTNHHKWHTFYSKTSILTQCKCML